MNKIPLTFFLFSILLIVFRCGKDPAITGQSEIKEDENPVLAAISINGPAVVTLSQDETYQLKVDGFDADGNPIDTKTSANWSVEIPSRVTVNPEGLLTTNGELGHTWTYAAIGDLRDSVAVWIQRPQSKPSAFKITLFFTDDVPGAWRSALEAAANRWQQVIRDTLPAVDVATLNDYCGYGTYVFPDSLRRGIERGVRIYVYVSSSFPAGTYTEAVGGPCIHRGLPLPTTVLGVISVNQDKLNVPALRLRYVAHHEMGHVLGIAGVVQGIQPTWLDAGNGLYRGHLALYGYSLEYGQLVSELSYANGSHWPVRELMGIQSSGRISHLSVGALMDLGYPAAWYGTGDIGIY